MTAEGDRIAEEHIDTLFVAAALASTMQSAQCTYLLMGSNLATCNAQSVCGWDEIYLHTEINT